MAGKQMSVRERLSLEFVTASGSSAYSGAATRADNLGALPDFVLFEGMEDESAPTQGVELSPALEAVDELKALFGAFKQSR